MQVIEVIWGAVAASLPSHALPVHVKDCWMLPEYSYVRTQHIQVPPSTSHLSNNFKLDVLEDLFLS